MKRNVKPITPRCGICKKLYSSQDDDGSGLCIKCRPVQSQPIVAMKRQIKQTIVMEVGKMMDDFDQEVIQEQVDTITDNQEQISDNITADDEKQVPIEAKSDDLQIEDLIDPGRYGVCNSQMVPALKKAIAEQSVAKIALLKKSYLYTYNKSIRYLKKAEREFLINNNL